MANFDVLSFFRDYAIPYAADSAKSTRNFANTRCPFCGGSEHLGWHLNAGYTHCWKCGHHNLVESIVLLTSMSKKDAIEITKEYEGYGSVRKGATLREGGATSVTLPGGPMSRFHKEYLAKRGFDPEYLEQTYALHGTAPNEAYNNVDFAMRVMIPIYDAHGQLISFQGRDITNQHKLKYKVCPLDLAVDHYKNHLYGEHLVKSDSLIVVEGVFDAWRGGKGFVATYGTAMTSGQIKRLSTYKKVTFLFDSEPEAQSKARKYGVQLAALGVKVENACLQLGDRDVGDLTESEIKEVRKELGIGNFL